MGDSIQLGSNAHETCKRCFEVWAQMDTDYGMDDGNDDNEESDKNNEREWL